jgi:thioredoxin 1
MLFVTDQKEIQFDSGICSIYFYSNWMPFHNKMIVILSKMETKYNNIKHLAIDVNSHQEVIKRFNIESIPTVLLMRDGKEIKRIVGIVLTSAMRSAYADI